MTIRESTSSKNGNGVYYVAANTIACIVDDLNGAFVPSSVRCPNGITADNNRDGDNNYIVLSYSDIKSQVVNQINRDKGCPNGLNPALVSGSGAFGTNSFTISNSMRIISLACGADSLDLPISEQNCDF